MSVVEAFLASRMPSLVWLVVDVDTAEFRGTDEREGLKVFRLGTVVKQDTYANCIAYIDANYP